MGGEKCGSAVDLNLAVDLSSPVGLSLVVYWDSVMLLCRSGYIGGIAFQQLT